MVDAAGPASAPRPRPLARGCALYLIVLGLVLVVLAGGAAAGVWWLMDRIRHSGGFDQAVALASADARVRAELGEPVASGWLVTGSIHISDGRGRSELSSSLTGTRAEGRLHMRATREDGVWTLSSVRVRVPSGELVLVPTETAPPKLPAEAPAF